MHEIKMSVSQLIIGGFEKLKHQNVHQHLLHTLRGGRGSQKSVRFAHSHLMSTFLAGPLMTSDYVHIYMVGRYRQGQHAHVTLRTRGQSQGHQGHFCIFEVFACFANSSFNSLIVGNSLEACVP